MIVKHFNENTWNFIGDIRHISSQHIDIKTLAEKYDKEIPVTNSPDIIVCPNDVTITEGVKMSNKAFMLATNNAAEHGDRVHSFSALDPFMVEDNYPAATIIMKLNKWREFDTEILVTNQTTYLMNDEGKTIERLV